MVPHFCFAAASTGSGVSDTVAIVALIVTGAAGVAGAVVLYLNTGRTIKAENDRQVGILTVQQKQHEADLEAATRRQAQALEAERARLHATIAAEERRSRWQAVREVLDRGAVLLTEFQAVVGELKVVEPGRLHLPDGWDRTTAEVGAFRGRLRLWFDDDHDVVKSFDDVLSHAVWASELREGIDDVTAHPVNMSPEQFEAMRPHFAEHIRSDVDKYRKQFLDAARKHLQTTTSFGDC